MKTSYVEEITLIMCECCMDFVIESDSQELKGASYCPGCSDMKVPPYNANIDRVRFEIDTFTSTYHQH